jgi:hypothetical protein
MGTCGRRVVGCAQRQGRDRHDQQAEERDREHERAFHAIFLLVLCPQEASSGSSASKDHALPRASLSIEAPLQTVAAHQCINRLGRMHKRTKWVAP